MPDRDVSCPSLLMDSVSLDMFAMPEVTFEGQKYDYMCVCVDRESGWMIATPYLEKGFTAEKLAKLMYKKWELFGIPSVVHSDKGAHFASAWWQTLCALMGVRVSYGQAYHHQDKGRVEVAGQQILGKLKTLILDLTEEVVSWVELLPKALRQIHDTTGETGFSPY